MDIIQTLLAFLSPICVAAIGAVQANWRRSDRRDAEAWREQQRLKEDERRQEWGAVENGVRSLLRSSIMRTHHVCVARGSASTVDKEVIERDFEAYRGLGGNGVAVSLHDEVMSLPTVEKE